MTTDPDERLAVRADRGVFSGAEVEGMDEPVRRYFNAAIVPGTPLTRAACLRIHGSIKLGSRWLPFRAKELLAPLQGYYWPATVLYVLLRGSDTYVAGSAAMRWKLLGLFPIVQASGPDVARSAMGRAVAEGIWLPTALLPRYGVEWRAESDEKLVAQVPISGERVTLRITIDGHGQVRSDHLDRWNDPLGNGAFGWTPFGVDSTSWASFGCGITIPSEGVGGWFHGTDRWHDGQFMRYAISALTPI